MDLVCCGCRVWFFFVEKLAYHRVNHYFCSFSVCRSEYCYIFESVDGECWSDKFMKECSEFCFSTISFFSWSHSLIVLREEFENGAISFDEVVVECSLSTIECVERRRE